VGLSTSPVTSAARSAWASSSPFFEAAGSASDDAHRLLAERVSASLTVACLLLALALAVTVIAHPRRRARVADGGPDASSPADGTGLPAAPRAAALTEARAAA
jgi:hypothetical protein